MIPVFYLFHFPLLHDRFFSFAGCLPQNNREYFADLILFVYGIPCYS